MTSSKINKKEWRSDQNMNIKFIFLSVLVLGLIVNTSAFSDLAFADKPDKEEKSKKIEAETKKAEAKAAAETKKAEAKAAAETKKAEAKGKEIKEFENGVVVDSSSTTSICHIPRGNPGNNHTITIGESAWPAHQMHGDLPYPCDYTSEEILGEIDTSNTDDNNDDIIEQISQQIAELQKKLEQLLGM